MSRNKYPQETVNLILDNSLKLFIEKGYENTSIQNIIDSLGGLTKGAIYHHFKSKEDIMMAVISKLLSVNDEIYFTKLISDNNYTGFEKLHLLLKATIVNPSQTEIFSSAPEMLKNPTMLALQIKSIFEESAPHLLLPIIEQGITDGSIKTKYPRQLAEVILLLINLWVTPMVYCDTEEIMKQRVLFFKELLLGIDVDLLDEEIIEHMNGLSKVYSKKRNKIGGLVNGK